MKIDACMGLSLSSTISMVWSFHIQRAEGSPPWYATMSRYDLVFGWIREGPVP
jgi:hypothetical protein